MNVIVIENGDDISIHFEGDRYPPLWFNRKTRPVAHAKLRAILNEIAAEADAEEHERWPHAS